MYVISVKHLCLESEGNEEELPKEIGDFIQRHTFSTSGGERMGR